jgi:hypothetical protein
MGLMPRWAQRLTGFDVAPTVYRMFHEPALRTTARTLRWAFGTPPFRRLADERVGQAAPGPLRIAA